MRVDLNACVFVGRRALRSAKSLAFIVAAFAVSPAAAQEIPKVITPPEVTTDPNGLNLLTGKVKAVRPTISVPAAPRLTYSRPSDFAMYVKGQSNIGTLDGFYTAQYGANRSESFECDDADCTPNNSNSLFSQGPDGCGTFTHEKTGENYSFMVEGQNYVDPNGVRHTTCHAWLVGYPDGEFLTFEYESFDPNDPASSKRVSRVQSNTGYFLDFDYWDSLGNQWWDKVKTAAIYADANPTIPLARLDYSSDGTQVTDIGGRTWNCAEGCDYSAASSPWQSSDSLVLPTESSPALTFENNPTYSFLTRTIDKDGVEWTYSYSGVATEYRLGELESYSFNSMQVTGPDGYHRTYDTKAISTGGDEPQLSVAYVESATDELNRTTDYTYELYNFNKAYRLKAITYPEGNSAHFEYDFWGNIIKRTDKAKPASGLADLVQQASYGGTSVGRWRPIWYRDARGNQTDFVFSAQTGLLEQQLDPADNAGMRRRTIIEYEAHPTAFGTIHRKKKVRICGVLATDTTTCVTPEPYTTFDYFGDTFLPTIVSVVADGQTRTTVTEYDPAGRVLSVDGPLPGTDDEVFNRYDIHGRKIWEIGAQAPNGMHIGKRLYYRGSDDKVYRVSTWTLDCGTCPPLTLINKTDTSFDSRRYPVRERTYLSSDTYTVTDRSFLDRGLPECTTVRMNLAALPPAGSHGACTPGTEGNDGPDRISKNIYDVAGQLVQVREGVTTSVEAAEATYSYTPNGKRQFVIDANGNRAKLEWDGFDRQSKWIFPSKTRASAYDDSTQATALATAGALNAADYEQYTYDAAGNRTKLRKRDGNTISYVYDKLDRVVRKGGAAVQDVDYSYDVMGRQLSATFLTGGDGVTNGYTGFGELETSTISMGGFTKTLTSSYDIAGRRTRLTHPDGQAFTYTYDALDRLTGVYKGIGTATPLDTFSYGNNGLLSSRAEAAGSAATYTWDAIGRLQSQSDTFSGASGDVSWSLAYNPASQVASETRYNDSYAWTGAQDGTTGYTANGLNQYASVDGTGFTYDANGNLTSDGTSTYAYDVENRLISVTTGGVTTHLRYDPLGRLWSVAGAAVADTRFLHDGNAPVIEYDASGNVAHRYVHGSNAEADDPLVWYAGAAVDSSTRRWLHADRLGSIVAVTNGSGGIFRKNSYDEYGKPADSNRGRFQYTGQMWFPEIGLYHYKARMYSPGLGRFLQVDPVGYEGGINLYAYVGNDPVNAVDPTGRDILYVAHHVGDRYYHTKVLIVPADQERFSNDRRFETSEGGRRFATLGAGPENMIGSLFGMGGKLIGQPNRESDVERKFMVLQRLQLPPGVSENAMIANLFKLDSNYKDNLPYNLFPTRGDGYNSNSYVSGLLKAAGFELRDPSVNTTGSEKPVPSEAFGISDVTVTAKPCVGIDELSSGC